MAAPGAEPRAKRRWGSGAVVAAWLALTLILGALAVVTLHGCGIRLFGSTLLDFCPDEPELADGPPPELLVEWERAERLDERLQNLKLEVAAIDYCPPPPEEQVAELPEEKPPEKPPEKKPPEEKPPEEQACRDIPPEERKVDLYLLLDASGSFNDDLPAIRSTVQDLIRQAAQGKLKGKIRLGLGSFIDKPLPPYPQLYTYKHHQSLTEDFAAVLKALRGIDIYENYDEPEAQLEAMLEAAGRAGAIGYADDAEKLLVVITDADYHRAGDFPSPAEDGKADGNALNEDYPSVAQVRRALERADLTPLFLVTADAAGYYRNLVAQLGRGSVQVISSNSSNLLAGLDQGVKQVCGEGLSE
jgi:hypothetical protein